MSPRSLRAPAAVAAAALALLWVVTAHAGLPPTPQPLSAEQKKIFFGSEQDAPPEKLDATRADLEGRHYLSGDERNLHLFYPKVKDIGGGYMGVGSDQAYMFAGWMKADLVWLCDYDPWIRHLHHAYAAFFHASETIEEFRAWWKPNKKTRDRAVAHLKAFYKDHPDRRKIVFVYARGTHKVNRRLRRLKKWFDREKVPSFVNDPATYDFVRALVTGGRVRPMLCNLLDDKGMTGAAEAAKALGVPIRVLYTSNAEQYWRYPEQFRKNIGSLPIDDKSIVVRTVATKPTNGDYHYNVQPVANFRDWLETDWAYSVKLVVPGYWGREKDEIPLTYVNDQPDAVRGDRDPKWRRAQRDE